jgi:ABC-type dipeptide/oligopeptide/nickel transport system permease subunit
MEKRKMKTGAFIRRYFRVMVGGTIILIMVIISLLAPILATHDPNQVNIYEQNIPPNAEHRFGTDSFGRDLYSRVVYGGRVSLVVSVLVNVLAVIIGSSIGLVCGYYHKVDMILMRLMEGLATLPTILLAIVMVTILGPGVGKLITVLVIVNLPGIARITRQQVLSIKEKEHVESAKASGASDLRIMFKYVLPLSFSQLIIRFTSGLASTCLTQASLSFLGVGLDPRIPTWGGIVNEGSPMIIVHPYQCLYAGIALSVTVLGFCILGDGVRDVLDPKLRG